MSKRALRSALIGVCASLSVLVVPAAANATALWVSNSAVSSPHNSCAHPGFNAVQPAIEAATSGQTVNVCSGTYVEQLTITKAIKLIAVNGAGTAKVTLPAKIEDATTSCETAIKAPYEPNQDEISICTAGAVTVTGLTVEALWPANTCYDSLYGIFVAGGGTLKATNVTVVGAGASPINGCQGGVGIEVGTARTEPGEIGHATITKVTVSNYQKDGVNVAGEGSTVTITGTTVTGAGATPAIAQNGIEAAFGGKAKIAGSTISGNECEVASVCGFSGTQAAGILFFGAGSSVKSSMIKENDFGLYYISESPTQPTTPEVAISADVFSANRYEGLLLDQGDASVKGNTITGPGKIGIDLYQYEGQSYAPTSSASKDIIEGMTEAAVKVESDKQPGDYPGHFTITGSSLSNNAQAVIDESSTFLVVL